jgi:hypothetical protein
LSLPAFVEDFPSWRSTMGGSLLAGRTRLHLLGTGVVSAPSSAACRRVSPGSTSDCEAHRGDVRGNEATICGDPNATGRFNPPSRCQHNSGNRSQEHCLLA